MPQGGDTPTYWDDQPITEACCAVIEDGPHKGVWMFSSKKLAERFCFERGFEPEFVEVIETDGIEDA